ncbi:VOC family protein [Arthrobacter sp. NPDC090010]|uniref:VOC family protein n=1 Tax=Arthrobacter sp. NPDC090010 TaxID=3363942 RepID=UPI0038145EB1
MRILGIDNIVLDVADVGEARRFYGELLGLAEKCYFPEAGVVGYRIGREEPGLVLRQRPGGALTEGRGPRLWLEVVDAEEAAAELTLAGVAIINGPLKIRTGMVVEVADPFGNVIGVVDYSSAPESARSTIS